MPTEQIVAILIAERDRLNRAIEALQGPVKRRGRPPKNPLAAAPVAAKVAPARHRTSAQKKAQSERMKKYWAQRKKQEKS
jgi:hypothetical protein